MTQPDLTVVFELLGAPTVLTGTVDGHPWFFRARHSRWRLEVNDVEISSGTWPESGIVEPHAEPHPWEALAIIVRELWHPLICYAVNRREDRRSGGLG